jgi:undecaprenyl diphosphate synthase
MSLPKHIAIIMDGNGRWAKKRHLPRIAGHQQGAESVRAIVSACAKKGIHALTLFAFSSENWSRPKSEVDFLLSLFLRSLRDEMQNLHKNNVRFIIIGDRSPFGSELQKAMQEAETLTCNNTGLKVYMALNYGGRWDIVQAAKKLAEKVSKGELKIEEISEQLLHNELSLNHCTDPDLLIRTSGEQRISNFLLWNLAYTELYFTETYWPDFREVELEKALEVYASRQRRFGFTNEQLIDAQATNKENFEQNSQTPYPENTEHYVDA